MKTEEQYIQKITELVTLWNYRVALALAKRWIAENSVSKDLLKEAEKARGQDKSERLALVIEERIGPRLRFCLCSTVLDKHTRAMTDDDRNNMLRSSRLFGESDQVTYCVNEAASFLTLKSDD